MDIKKTIIKIKWIPTAIINKMVFRIRDISYGKNLVTFGTIFVRGTGNIKIGNDVRITSCRETNPIGGDCKTILFAKGSGKIIIGDHTGISNAAIVAQEKIELGNNVLIGANCKIYDHDFHSLVFEERMMNVDPGVKSAPVMIKDGAFVGAHSIILKGVTIGSKSIIGAGSVVTRSIPDGEIWAGNPAKCIQKAVPEKRRLDE